jgi:hypothetical protein
MADFTWTSMEGQWLRGETSPTWSSAIKHVSHIYIVRFISERNGTQGLRPTVSMIHMVMGGRKQYVDNMEIGSIGNYKAYEPDRGDLHMAIKSIFDVR